MLLNLQEMKEKSERNGVGSLIVMFDVVVSCTGEMRHLGPGFLIPGVYQIQSSCPRVRMFPIWKMGLNGDDGVWGCKSGSRTGIVPSKVNAVPRPVPLQHPPNVHVTRRRARQQHPEGDLSSSSERLPRGLNLSSLRCPHCSLFSMRRPVSCRRGSSSRLSRELDSFSS